MKEPIGNEVAADTKAVPRLVVMFEEIKWVRKSNGSQEIKWVSRKSNGKSNGSGLFGEIKWGKSNGSGLFDKRNHTSM
jgi:hypothetical protein